MVRHNKVWILLAISVVLSCGNHSIAHSIETRFDSEAESIDIIMVDFASPDDLETFVRRSHDRNFGFQSASANVATDSFSEGESIDAYWQYYGDCDRWGVIFFDVSQQPVKNALPARVQTLPVESSRSNFSLAEPIHATTRFFHRKAVAINQWVVRSVVDQSEVVRKQFELVEFGQVESVSEAQDKKIDWKSAARLLDIDSRRCDLEMAFANQVGWLGKSLDSFSQQLSRRIERRRCQIHAEIRGLENSRIAERENESKIK